MHSCIGIRCDSLRDPQNGHISASSITPGTDLGSIAEYSCDDGYRLVGPRTRTCQANGQWTEESAVCGRMQRAIPQSAVCGVCSVRNAVFCFTGIVDCGNVEDPKNGWVNVSGVGEAATAEYYCRDGYRLVDGSQTHSCGEDSQWIGVAPTCQGKPLHNTLLFYYAY